MEQKGSGDFTVQNGENTGQENRKESPTAPLQGEGKRTKGKQPGTACFMHPGDPTNWPFPPMFSLAVSAALP